MRTTMKTFEIKFTDFTTTTILVDSYSLSIDSSPSFFSFIKGEEIVMTAMANNVVYVKQILND